MAIAVSVSADIIGNPGIPIAMPRNTRSPAVDHDLDSAPGGRGPEGEAVLGQFVTFTGPSTVNATVAAPPRSWPRWEMTFASVECQPTKLNGGNSVPF